MRSMECKKCGVWSVGSVVCMELELECGVSGVSGVSGVTGVTGVSGVWCLEYGVWSVECMKCGVYEVWSV